MALYRSIQMSFWTDPKVEDDYTADDKYFYLYLMTNPHTNLCGCYEISVSQMQRETGIKNIKKVEELLARMEKVHNNVVYSRKTKEILILRWYKYNWTSSEKFRKPLLREIQKVKCKEFEEYLMSLFNGENTVSDFGIYGIDTTDSVTVSDAEAVAISDSNNEEIKEIVDYLNLVLGTKYRSTTPGTVKHIKARLKEGRTVDDFKEVIDKKYEDWRGDEKMAKYLTPDTLFGSKFEKYLNQNSVDCNNDVFTEWSEA